MTINDLVKQAHENAKSKGWWEEERTFGEQIALMHSELSEALEEFRNGLLPNEVYYNTDKEKGLLWKGNIPNNIKPEGIPIELADVIIRIFDTCGRYKKDLEIFFRTERHSMAYNNFGEFISVCHLFLSRAMYDDGNYGDGFRWLAVTYLTIEQFCTNNKINLEEAIRIKMEYNTTRPHKHGGKKI